MAHISSKSGKAKRCKCTTLVKSFVGHAGWVFVFNISSTSFSIKANPSSPGRLSRNQLKLYFGSVEHKGERKIDEVFPSLLYHGLLAIKEKFIMKHILKIAGSYRTCKEHLPLQLKQLIVFAA